MTNNFLEVTPLTTVSLAWWEILNRIRSFAKLSKKLYGWGALILVFDR